MVYAYLQGAQDAEAKRGVDRSVELRKNQAAIGSANPTGAFLAPYAALAAILRAMRLSGEHGRRLPRSNRARYSLRPTP